ncbi:MAG: amidase, partial [Deltaproteobacteria bacterium]|nr:amidase [Deltaproteobacteria bacterium]
MSNANFLNKIKIVFFILLFIQTSCQSPSLKEQIAGMDSFSFLEQDVAEIQQGYKDGAYTIKELIEAYLERIEEIDKSGPMLSSIIQINPDAIQNAEQLDIEMMQGNIRGPLHGIPVLLKDNIDTHDKMATTGGSRALINSYPLKDSYVAKQLKEAGAIIIGKANLSEWA